MSEKFNVEAIRRKSADRLGALSRRLRPEVTAPPPGDFVHAIEMPTEPAQTGNNNLRVKGWVRSLGSPVVAVSFVSGDTVVELDPVERPKLAENHHPAHIFGYRQRVPKRLMAPGRTAVIRVETKDEVRERPVAFATPPEMTTWLKRRKELKLERLAPVLRTPDAASAQLRTPNGAMDLSGTDAFAVDFEETELISSNGYDFTALELIARHRDGVVVDVGAGLRSHYFENVVNLDLGDYLSTDVVGTSTGLPFEDESVDAILSLSVLEHVRNPFQNAAEIQRVLKPGGEVYIAAPLLAPVHGYPNHFYNMTSNGLSNLFGGLTDHDLGVPDAGKPVWALSWILSNYLSGLPEHLAHEFSNLTVRDLMVEPRLQLSQDYVQRLSEDVEFGIAAATTLRAKKPIR